MHLAGRKGIQEPQKRHRGDRRCNFSVPSQIQQYGTGIANAEPLPVLGRKSVKAELLYDWTNACAGTRWLPCAAILL